MVKIAIIGAGVTGMSIARELSKYQGIDVQVIEKQPDVGWGVSKANTALIHGGYDDDPEKFPVRAKLCIRGNRLWHRWVKELQIPHIWNGALIVAKKDEDYEELDRLLERGKKNGVPEMRLVDREELRALEPNVTPDAIGGLWIPIVGQIGPIPAVIAIAENAVENGVKIQFNSEVTGIEQTGNGWVIETTRSKINADYIINAAGLYADRIAAMAGFENFSITPRKGEYWLFDDAVSPKPNRVLFPTPTPISKGVVVTSEISGHLMIGPNAQNLPADEKENLKNTREGLDEVWNKATEIWPNMPPRSKVIRTFAGLRPEPPDGDFIIRHEDAGFINAAGIRSPGLTSAPAIAEEVAGILEKLGVELNPKSDWNPYRKEISHFFMMTPQTINEMVKKNPAYGKIVCRCNKVSEGDILEAIDRMKYIGVNTPCVDSVKFRTKASTGTCQGSFCRPRIVKLLADAYQVPPWKVTLKGEGSEIGAGDVKLIIRGDAQ